MKHFIYFQKKLNYKYEDISDFVFAIFKSNPGSPGWLVQFKMQHENCCIVQAIPLLNKPNHPIELGENEFRVDEGSTGFIEALIFGYMTNYDYISTLKSEKTNEGPPRFGFIDR